MEETVGKRKIRPWRMVLRVLLFTGILLGLILIVSGLLINKGDGRPYRNVGGFYQLEENTVDVVCIGSSRTYAFWTPLFAYERHGIRMYSLATAAQPIEAARYLIEEALKTQPGTAFVVNLDDVREDKPECYHQLLDYFRFSGTKLRLINALSDKLGTPLIDRLEYIFTIIRYHSRWQELTESDFWKSYDGMMGSTYTDTFLYSTEDETGNVFEQAGEAAELDEHTRDVIRELVTYCNERGVRLLLTMSPQAEIIPETLARRAAVCEYAESLGATVLDMQFLMDEIGLDLARDYYNAAHTNVHGSFKFTAYVSDYLVKLWNLPDRHGEAASEPWEAGLHKFRTLAAPALLPFEWQPENRTQLAAPGYSAEWQPEGGVSVSFTAADGADGYEIFAKKGARGAWYSVSEQQEPGTYTDAGGEKNSVYLVAAYKESGNGRFYGTVDYAGKPVQVPKADETAGSNASAAAR